MWGGEGWEGSGKPVSLPRFSPCALLMSTTHLFAATPFTTAPCATGYHHPRPHHPLHHHQVF